MHQITDKLKTLYRQWSGVEPETNKAIAVSGSERKYYRLCSPGKSAIGVWNGEKEENLAFLHFTGHFQKHGLRVATVYAVDPDMEAYLLEDMGDVSLFSMLENNKSEDSFPPEVEKLYRESLKELIRFQVIAGKDLDYSYCYPHAAFDLRSMKWDLNYFKYYFLKPNVPFHEGRLEDDFETLTAYLGKADSGYFMYRDFQARNIMIHDGKPCFIDYQGGRKGPLHYDVASLLFQVKADLPYDKREELLDFYITELSGSVDIDRKIFREHYYGFVLIRLIQVLGAYGFRGVIERKPHFLTSIPFALKNLAWWLNHDILPLDLPELRKSLQALTKIEKYQQTIPVAKPGKLSVVISSFSYRHGFPEDMSGNGGGFVFDCRALPNPGREERYRAFNGKDQVIIDYLKDEPDVINFLCEAEKLVGSSVENYLQRGFSSLTVSFGCTGGQHRSVYCAETLAESLKERFPQVNFKVEHLMVRG